MKPTRRHASGVLTLIALTAATAVQAQSREGRWELNLGTFYQLGTDVDEQNGSTIETDDEFGFALGGGYNFSDRLATSLGLQWVGVGYDATVVDQDGETSRISGSFDQFTLAAIAILYLSEGALAPYVGGGLGWTWIDTKIPDGPPVGGCWWDPWWGYVCYTDYPTKTTDAFTYQLTLGLRYELNNDRTFLRLGYTSEWMDFDNGDGTPRLDVIVLDIGWMF